MLSADDVQRVLVEARQDLTGVLIGGRHAFGSDPPSGWFMSAALGVGRAQLEYIFKGDIVVQADPTTGIWKAVPASARQVRTNWGPGMEIGAGWAVSIGSRVLLRTSISIDWYRLGGGSAHLEPFYISSGSVQTTFEPTPPTGHDNFVSFGPGISLSLAL